MTRRFLTVALVTLMVAPPLPAQDVCTPCYTDYRVVCQTVYEEKPVTTRRLETETIVEERQVVRYRPVWETTTRERRYTVSKPVVETSMREERKTVMKPVWEKRVKDMSYNRVRYVAQTSSRTERRVVQRPVMETQMREEQRVVQRPITQTVMQDQISTVFKPVTTLYQRTVDQGGFVDQLQHRPGNVSYRLRWQGAQCATNPATGQSRPQRAGLYWVPKQSPGTFQVNRQFVSNPVVQQMSQTQLVPEQVTQKVPVNVTTTQAEVQVRQVPVQVVKMQSEEQVREVPVTVQRPVVERVPRFVPEYRCRWVPQEYVRQVPVNTYKFVTEERVEQIPVRTCRMVAEHQTVQVPKTQSRWVEETMMRTVPRTVLMKIPLDSSCTTYSTVSSVAPVAYNTQIISDTPVVTEYSEPLTIQSGPLEAMETEQIEPLDMGPFVETEPTPATDSIPPAVPKGSRPVIESGWRTQLQDSGWRSASRLHTNDGGGLLFRISSK